MVRGCSGDEWMILRLEPVVGCMKQANRSAHVWIYIPIIRWVHWASEWQGWCIWTRRWGDARNVKRWKIGQGESVAVKEG